jgi:hypothetical protein
MMKIGAALLGQVGGAVLGFVIGLALAWAVGLLKGRESTAEAKLEDVLSRASRQHLRPIFNREIDLKGTGKTARVLIFRAADDRYGLVNDSDRLLVYERDGNKLDLVLSVHPSFHPKRNLPFVFHRVRAGRFDETTQQEVLFDMSPLYADTKIPHPVALLWDASKRTYAVRPLLDSPPKLPVPASRSFARGLRDAYRPTDIELDGGSALERVGGAQEYAVGSNRIAVAYVVRDLCNACAGGTYTVRTYSLNFQRDSRVARLCQEGRRVGHPTPKPKVFAFEKGPKMQVAVRAALKDRTLACP